VGYSREVVTSFGIRNVRGPLIRRVRALVAGFFSRSWCRLGVVCAVLVLAAFTGFLTILENYEVLEKGRLLAHSGGLVYKVRFFGSFDLFIEPDHQLDKDVLNAFMLVGVAFISLTFGVLYGWLKGRQRGDFFRFSILMFLGMSWLAADELLGIHETLGHNLMFLAELPFVDRPDDVIILLYSVPAFLFLARFRKTILASRPALILMGLALVFYLVGALGDLFKLPVERISELLSSACIIASVMLLGLSHMQRALEGLLARDLPQEPSLDVLGISGDGGQTSPRGEARSPTLSGAG
jgi:hypothetical protein